MVIPLCPKTPADPILGTHNGACGYAGLDTNGCPLGNSKFTLLSDNLNICQWLSACQVEKIYQNQIQIDTNFDNPTSDLDVIYDFNQFNPNCFWFILKTKWFCWKALFTPVLVVVKSVFPQLATTLSGDTTIILGIVCKVLWMIRLDSRIYANQHFDLFFNRIERIGIIACTKR